GIRLALGATRAQILRLVLGEGVGLTLFGIALGLGGTVALTRVLRAWLFGTAPTDVVTLASATLVLLAVGLGSCLVPARRATKVEPATALRAE
ncbi:MAG TPA: FtsX-like permease family protein, partial [Opitutaceae bacterium]|nr:FtsX-like permease family protein [Opitutaceae bacterium]